jgi:hypothetical protein
MNFFLLILASFGILVTNAQSDTSAEIHPGNFEKIEATEVPMIIINKFESMFTGASAIQWEKHATTGSNNSTNYVVLFTEGAVKSRAKYKEDGTPISSAKFFGAQKLPANIKAATNSKYPDFAIIDGEEITTKNGKTFYRVTCRNGSTKMIQYFEANGAEVIKDKAPEGLVDDIGN